GRRRRRPYHVAVAVLAIACSTEPQDRPASPAAAGAAQNWFVDAAAASGLDFKHVNGMSGKYYYAEIIGAGVALFDYDNDGDLDVLLVQGQPLATGNASAAGERGLRARLFRNDLKVNADGTRVLHFTDVTDESRLDAHGYGMGVAT